MVDKDAKDASNFYLIFISLIFAVFLSVWIEPIAAQLFDKDLDNPLAVLQVFLSLKNITGGIMFMMLVCLWWWYGMFIGKIDPAKGFPMFAYDFISLGSFAIAFRVWPQPFAFPVTVFVAALLMLGRFAFAGRSIKRGEHSVDCPAQKAIRAALIVLGLFIFTAAMGVIMMSLMIIGEEETVELKTNVKKFWEIIKWVVIILLAIGVAVTVHAAKLTEGFRWREIDTWRNPNDVEKWLKAPPTSPQPEA